MNRNIEGRVVGFPNFNNSNSRIVMLSLFRGVNQLINLHTKSIIILMK